MSNTSIPKSIQEIIDKIIWYNFRPFTYKKLSAAMHIDPNTLAQRINRNPDYFDISGFKPKIIKLNKDLEEIYFYRDEYTCQICQQKKEPNELLIRFKDPYIKNKDKWDNVITSCQKCKEIDLLKKLSYKNKGKSLGQIKYIWEYKEITIRFISERISPYMELYYSDLEKSDIKIEYENYYEFDELNGQGWFHIIDNDNKRCENLSDILNFFGKQGWELIKMKEDKNFEGEPMGEYQCIFKRKKSMEET